MLRCRSICVSGCLPTCPCVTASRLSVRPFGQSSVCLSSAHHAPLCFHIRATRLRGHVTPGDQQTPRTTDHKLNGVSAIASNVCRLLLSLSFYIVISIAGFVLCYPLCLIFDSVDYVLYLFYISNFCFVKITL